MRTRTDLHNNAIISVTLLFLFIHVQLNFCSDGKLKLLLSPGYVMQLSRAGGCLVNGHTLLPMYTITHMMSISMH